MDKSILRKKIRTQRKNLSKAERTQKDRAIAQRLEAHPLFQTATTILFYVSNQEEVDTHTLIQKYLDKKIILVPIVQGSNLEITQLKQWNDLQNGNYDILEPSQPYKLFEGIIDLIIVPCVAFDPTGHRIGYGKGYYDTFLANQKAPTLGLAYDLQITKKIPRDPHDIQLNQILTESTLITTS